MQSKSSFHGLALTTALFFLLLPAVLFSQPQLGKWYCVEASYSGVPITDFEATITFLDADYFETRFDRGSDWGRSKTQYTFSANKDTLYDVLPNNVPTTYGGRSSTINGKLLYEYMLGCPQDLWEQAGQTAIGWGFPAGAAKSFVLVAMEGDSILYLKSWDKKTVLTYTYGAKRPLHNPVTFRLNLNIQIQLGNFNPAGGDKVVLDYRLGAETKEMVLTASALSGFYEGTIDLVPHWIDSTITYRYAVFQSASSSWVIERTWRSFVLAGGGQTLGMDFFDHRARVNEIGQFAIEKNLEMQTSPAIAHDPYRNRFLAVWEEWTTATRTCDLFGRFSDKNGPLGTAFRITSVPSASEASPAVAFITAAKKYMVVWMDARNGYWDIFGIRLDDQGLIIDSPRSLADGSFVICDHDSLQYHPRLSYNPIDNTLLCVWEDYRSAVRNTHGMHENVDVFGQRLTAEGLLLPPGNPADTKSNFPIAARTAVDEFYPDVAHLGAHGIIVNEWMVVFSRTPLPNYGTTEVWGVRIDGETGQRLDTWGRVVATTSLAKSATGGAPPWLPEFPLGYGKGSSGSWAFCGSPHVASNDLSTGYTLQKALTSIYPIPEFLVAWTEYAGGGGNILCQRIAYFPDSTAFRLNLKPALESDTLLTAALVDAQGDLPPVPMLWKLWPSIPVCDDPYEQSWNDVAFNSQDNTFLVLWNDWRNSNWDGDWDPAPGWTMPAADLYGQRLWINPADSSLGYLDEIGQIGDSPLMNTPIVYSEADEGCGNYPAVVYGHSDNRFFIAYEYQIGTAETDIYGCMYNDSSPLPTGISEQMGDQPADYSLSQNFPNPFNPATEIQYTIAKPGRVKLEIFNYLGQKMATLFDQEQISGRYYMTWTGHDALGRSCPSGLYFYRLQVDDQSITKKMLLMK